jgi:purine-binding chemotaxis protein CheW
VAQDKDSNLSNKQSRADALIEDYLGEFFAPVNAAQSSASLAPADLAGTSVAGGAENCSDIGATKTEEKITENAQRSKQARKASVSEPPRESVSQQEKSLLANSESSPGAVVRSQSLHHDNNAAQKASPAFQEKPATKEFMPSPERAKASVIPGLLPKLKRATPAPQPETKVETEAKIEVETKTTAAVKPVTPSVEEIAAPAEPLSPAPFAQPKAPIAASSKVEIIESAVAERTIDIGEAPPAAPARASFRDYESFEILLFEVKGLQLAVPLISLGSIHKIEAELTPIFGRADWFMGMYHVNDQNLNVVDTCRWVMPSRYDQADREGYRFLIRLGDSKWALACDEVNQSVRLSKSEVKWRTESSKRPWLAGTVIDRMCALLDVDSMAGLLDENAMHK